MNNLFTLIIGALLATSASAYNGVGQIGSGSIDKTPVKLEQKKVLGIETPRISGQMVRSVGKTHITGLISNMQRYNANEDVILETMNKQKINLANKSKFAILALSNDVQEVGSAICGTIGESLQDLVAMEPNRALNAADYIAPVFDSQLKVHQFLVADIWKAKENNGVQVIISVTCTNSRNTTPASAAVDIK